MSEFSEFRLEDLSSRELLARWQEGDQPSADLLVGRYSMRLVALLASRMNRCSNLPSAPEDVVQSAFGSFFGRIGDGRLRPSTIDSIWGLLATIAKRKMHSAIDKEMALKRGGHLHRVPLAFEASVSEESASGSATELHSRLLELFQSDERRLSILNSLLNGVSQKDIARELGLSDRTVRRDVQEIRIILNNEIGNDYENKATTLTKHRTQVSPVAEWSYGQFVLRRMIGQGTFGKVYLAAVQKDGADIAVKFLKRTFWEESDALVRFQQEAYHASQVSGHRVVRYRGWGTSPHGGPFLVMNYINGKSLALNRSAADSQFRRWLLQICEGLHSIHDQNIIHGDLTPNNILIDQSHDVHVTDFGFASQIDEADRNWPHQSRIVLRGTIGFLAPEQLSPYFGSISPATDIFAIGAVAYWYATGKTICAGMSNMDAISFLLSEKPIDIPPDLPDWLRLVLQRCLQRAVSARPSNIGEVMRMLNSNAP